MREMILQKYKLQRGQYLDKRMAEVCKPIRLSSGEFYVPTASQLCQLGWMIAIGARQVCLGPHRHT